MPRSLVLPLTMLLLLATGMAMLASAILLPGPTAVKFSAPGGASTEIAVVEQFYAAVNEAIATGSATALTGVVHPSFADENPLPGVHPGLAGLEDYLTDLHDTDPTLRLQAEVIAASANLVVTRVEAHRNAVAFPTAPSVEPQTVWSPIEGFRLADGVIVGRWSHTSGLVLTQPLVAQQVDLPIPTPRVVSLMRVTQAPGTRWEAPRVAGPRLLVLQAGVLEVEAVPEAARGPGRAAGHGTTEPDKDLADAPKRVMLTAGTTWLAPAGMITSTMSVGSTDAQLLVVSFTEPRLPNGLPPAVDDLPSGVTVQVLAGDLATALGTGSVTVSLEQISFAPDADLTLWSTQGPLLVAVETGQIQATASGTSWVRRSQDGMSMASREDILSVDKSLLLQPGGMVALRNDEPSSAHAVVVMIQQVNFPTTPRP